MASRPPNRKILSLVLTLIVVLLSGYLAKDSQLGQRGQQLAQANQPNLYRVTEVVDGDTIRVDMTGRTETIRYIGVDTPETHHPDKNVQCFGKAAANYNRTLIGGNPVRLESDAQNTNRDRYGRLLRYVYLPDGTLVNGRIIRDGYGFAYTSFPFSKIDEFRSYQQDARLAGRGLWQKCQVTTEENGIEQTNDDSSGQTQNQ